MLIGVLALQGAVAEHIRMLEMAGAEGMPVKKVSELEQLDGLIIPGGESTTIGRLMVEYGFIEAIREFAAKGKPIFGTCAGLIIIADEIVGQANTHLKLMDMKVSRNAFGRQRESFETDLSVSGITEPVRAVFIRAPLITEVGPDVEVLAVYQDQIVAAKQDNLLACSFHPELTNDHHLHAYFVAMAEQHKLVSKSRE
jgi:5'-phosphate synthase pdxT subunit